MRGEVYRFVAVDFIYDENVAGNLYWYLCPEEQIFVGDEVEAPIGRDPKDRKKMAVTERIKSFIFSVAVGASAGPPS